MMEGGPKDNANPTIHVVEKTGPLMARKRPLGWSQVETLHIVPLGDNDKWDEDGIAPCAYSAEARAVMHALLDASMATQGKGVALLRDVGVSIPPHNSTASNVDVYQKYLSSSSAFVPRALQLEQQAIDAERQAKQQGQRDAIDADEIYEIIRNIQDPEHPNTLEQLRVVSREQIVVKEMEEDGGDNLADFEEVPKARFPSVEVRFTPTVPHCSMATLIGLCITVKLKRSLPKRFKLRVSIEAGMHATEDAVNKQLADKERVSAALENKHLSGIVNKCIREGMALAQ